VRTPGIRREHVIGAGCVAVGFAVVALLVALTGGNLGDAVSGWFQGAFGTPYAVAQTLAYATPLVLIALGASVPLRAGVVVVGAEGQVVAGAIAAAAVALSPLGALPPVAALALGALAGAAGGAAWSLLPGIALVRWRVPEILSALLANLIAVQLLTYLLRTSLRDPAGTATPRSAILPDASLIPTLPLTGRLTAAAIGVLVLVAAIVWWQRTRAALLLEVYADRRWLAERLDVGPLRAVLATTAVSGAAAGLAGWIQLAGVDGSLTAGVSGGVGFSGLVVAVLGRTRPVPILFAGIVYGSLTTGASGIQLATGTTPAAVGTITQAVLLATVALAVVVIGRRGAARRAARAGGAGG
jgi:ABC-type uncharacterized transport system permease subunit